MGAGQRPGRSDRDGQILEVLSTLVDQQQMSWCQRTVVNSAAMKVLHNVSYWRYKNRYTETVEILFCVLILILGERISNDGGALRSWCSLGALDDLTGTTGQKLGTI